MSERLPYEQQLNQQWIDLPLPDEDMAWADMKRRLEDDDNEGMIAWWRRGCALWGLLLLLLAIGWWAVRPEKWFEHKMENVKTDTLAEIKKGNTIARKTLKNISKSDSEIIKVPKDISYAKLDKDSALIEREHEGGSKKIPPVNFPRQVSRKTKKESGYLPGEGNQLTDNTDTAFTNTSTGLSQVDTTVTIEQQQDSVKPANVDTAEAPQTAPSDSTKKRPVYFSAGIAVQQQIPVAGQKVTPYSAVGRKGSLLDYIPSVYVRLNRKDKWFIQAEFKYGAPQYNKEFLYRQTIYADSAGPAITETTTSDRLKKTFYHQLPLTFNYYVKPGWSIGGGIIWNKFYGAVSDREIIEFDNTTQQETVKFQGIVDAKKDAANTFAKSYFQGVVESQYKWKRFSAGTRYAFGLQPYIRFTLPGAEERKERNSNLQVFLHFELWKSR